MTRLLETAKESISRVNRVVAGHPAGGKDVL